MDIDAIPEFMDRKEFIKDNCNIPLSCYPQPFQDFIEGVNNEQMEFAARTVLVLRWRMGIRGQPHNPFIRRSDSWSFDGKEWWTTPKNITVYFEQLAHPRVQEDIRLEIENYVKEKEGEQIGHELFREAWMQRRNNPRSSLVIGIASVETHFKKYVSKAAPHTSWLIENVPSPPLVKMLNNYLPDLPSINTFPKGTIPPPKAVRDLLIKGVAIRNQIVHGKNYTLDRQTLEKILLALQDTLWMLDFYSGYDWALDFIRDDTKVELEKT